MFSSIGKSLLLTMLVGLTFSNATQATPIKWTLQNVTFNDGGSAFGSFFFDATTNAYSGISVTTTPGSSFGGTTYNFVYPTPPASGPGLLGLITNNFPGKTGEYNMPLLFAAPLTNAGGTINLALAAPSGDYLCLTELCAGIGAVLGIDLIRYRQATGGWVSAVPIPPAVWLFGSALGLMGAMRRRISS